MKFRSVIGKSPAVSFQEALFRGLAPDGSLYIPESFPLLHSASEPGESRTLTDIASEIIGAFVDDIPAADIRSITEQALNFPIPLVRLEENLYLLELYHGPTLAFKDVGARFMARALSYFLEREHRQLTIAVATSGDTGSAVAHGFLNVPNISVFVFYPSGKISRLQEQQMTTLGGNIHAVEVEGTFDDCQALVKRALADQELVRSLNLTTANSINLGRLIPQTTYYVWAIAQLSRMPDSPLRAGVKPVLVVPSGNFGNLTAAVYAKSIGAPIERFVSASNANDVVLEYFATGVFRPRPSLQTYSNAMDVGNPSNFARLLSYYEGNNRRMEEEITALSISDNETLAEMRHTYDQTGHVLDPHTAVGVAAARKVTLTQPTIVASTAHPGKFPEVVERALGRSIPLPPQLDQALRRQKQSVRIPAEYARAAALLRP